MLHRRWLSLNLALLNVSTPPHERRLLARQGSVATSRANHRTTMGPVQAYAVYLTERERVYMVEPTDLIAGRL
jgi:hypothetical protein